MPALGLVKKQTFSYLEDDELLTHANNAWFRKADKGGSSDQPSSLLSSTFICDQTGERFAVLRNSNGVLAVYRQAGEGRRISRIDKWPKALG